MTKILLQTTIPYEPDDWHIGRFSLLSEHLESLKEEKGIKGMNRDKKILYQK